MKIGVVILILCLILAGVIFGFGWIQILLPAETYAVIFTKTGGFDDTVTRPGEFSWRWERLLPTNLKLYRYPLRAQTAQVELKETLPSGELYARILPENPDFTVRGTLEIQFSIRPESLPRLAKEEKVFPERLQEYYANITGALTSSIADLLHRGELLPASSSSSAELMEALRKGMERDLPDILILGLNLQGMRLPDPELYALARQSYRSLVESRDRSRDEAVAALAEERAHDEATLESLAAYGDLLTRYPVLLKAMYVQRLSGKELVAVPGFDLDKVLSSLEAKASIP